MDSRQVNTGFLPVDAHPSTAVLQKNVNILSVFKVVVKLHNMSMIKHSVQLNLFINLQRQEGGKSIVNLVTTSLS